MKIFREIKGFWVDLLHRPLRVLTLCFFVLGLSLIIDGSLISLWQLHREDDQLSEKISKVQIDTKKMEMKIQKVSDLKFLELEARNRLDLVSEGDLIFIFTEE